MCTGAPAADLRPSSSAFPIEIYETIIDNVKNSSDQEAESGVVPRTLARCARTCQAWLPRSRLCLYRTIYLEHLTASASAIANTVKLRRLAQTIQVCPHLRDLVEDLFFTQYPPVDSNLIHPMYNLLPFFSRVCHLSLAHSAMDSDVLLVCCTGLASLHMEAVQFDIHFQSFLDCLSGMKQLRSLLLRDVSWKILVRDTPLTVTARYAECAPHVTYLGCFELDRNWAEMLTEIFAPHLKQLEWGALGDNRPWFDPDARRELSQLESLTISHRSDCIAHFLETIVGWPGRLERLHTITIVQADGRNAYAFPTRWVFPDSGRVQEMILAATGPALARVTVVCEGERWGPSAHPWHNSDMARVFEDCREQQFPELDMRGVLRVAVATERKDLSDTTHSGMLLSGGRARMRICVWRERSAGAVELTELFAPTVLAAVMEVLGG